MVEKRPYPEANGGQDPKRAKPSNNTPPNLPPHVAAVVAQAKARAQALAEAKKNAEAIAKRLPGDSSIPAPLPSQQDETSQSGTGVGAIQARLAALRAKSTQTQPQSQSQSQLQAQAPASSSSSSDPKAAAAAVAAKLAALRAKSTASPSSDHPPVRPPPRAYGGPVGRQFQSPPPPPPPEPEPEVQRGRGGLAIGLHPALLGDAPQAPLRGTALGNRRTEAPQPAKKKQLEIEEGPSVEEMKANPYFDPRLSTSAGRSRMSRSLVFNQKGKYVEQANKLRAQARLEEIKRELAEAARRAGVDENSERGFVVHAPPDVEWWDEGILEDKTYDCIDNPAKVKLSGEGSIVTPYVQHPVLLKPPQEQRLIQVKPLYLTQKEQAKLRRTRRAADLKETQAKIRLGLEPPPPPKIKRGNMMRVMGEQAIADPTAVEMLVESQIRDRAEAHERANEERKLTKEQRLEKLAHQQQMDAQKGLHMCVFKIDSLAFGKHRYRIDITAKEHALTGVTIMNPQMNLVIVEGGAWSIDKYKKLMLNRIKWTENDMPSSVREGNREAEAQWLQSVDADGNLKDLSFNKCQLIFEGEVKDRQFRRWSSKVCESDGEARDFLGRQKLDSLWALAKSAE